MSTRPYLGVNVNAASVEELRYRGLLEEGETLLALFDGVLVDENRRRVGGVALADFVALTDQRLITWARGFFNDAVDGFGWSDVDVLRAETWDPWHGRVALAFRLPAVAPRTRRIMVKGVGEDTGSDEQVIINVLDYMPAEDAGPMAKMVGWIGDQVLAGVSGEALVAAFGEEFPAPERKPAQPFFAQVDPAPPAAAQAPQPAEKPKRRWWQRAKEEADGQPALTPPATPGNLIAAYESQRAGLPAGDGGAPAPFPAGAGPLPTLPEQPSMYEVSRSLNLLLAAPRRLARSLRRAGEMVSGASELVNGMQDPRVRRNAMRGLYHAAAQQELEGGPLARVGPVVRAAVRFSEPLEDEQAEANQSRRIQVRAPARRAAPAPVEVDGPEAPAAREEPAEPKPIRRSINVRRVEPEPQAPPAEPEPEAPRAPVRRIMLSRSEEPLAPVSFNGNGKHPPEE